MRRLGIWTGVAVLGLALGTVTVRADDSEDEKPVATHWWNRVWPSSAEKPVEEDDEKPTKVKKPEAKEVVKAGPTAREKAIALREKEKANFLRRQAVCTKLMQIALENEDLELHRRADELNERAWSIYMQRTAALPSAPATPSDPVAITQLELDMPPKAKPAREMSSIRGLTDVDDVPASGTRKEKP